MRLVMSVSWSSPWLTDSDAAADTGIEVIPRRKDWLPTRRMRISQSIRNAIGVLRASRDADAVVVCTTAADAIAAAVVLRLRPRVTLAVWDFLLPANPRVRRVARAMMRRVDCWMVIRRSDAATFADQLGARDVVFVPYPAFAAGSATGQGISGKYVYAAGTAYRDWDTLLAAAEKIEAPIRISTVDDVRIPSAVADRVTALPHLSPAEGRLEVAGSALVCVPFRETDLPSGPVIIVDALAHGRPVVATDVGGSRDYIIDGVTGYLVPPADAGALAAAVRSLIDDEPRRAEMGRAAREFATSELAPGTVLATMRQALAQSSRRR